MKIIERLKFVHLYNWYRSKSEKALYQLRETTIINLKI